MIRSLADILPAIANNFDVAASEVNWGRPAAETVVLLLIDGLGYLNLMENLDITSLDSSSHTGIMSAIPSTTPVSLTALGTGRLAGANGMLGATVWLPEYEQILKPLHWETEPHPLAIQPEKTWFEKIHQQVPVIRIGPAKYANSGLTQSALRGGEHLAADSLSELIETIQIAQRTAGNNLIYAYYPDLDKIGHVHGVDSKEWKSELERVVKAIKQISDGLKPNSRFIVTADHGMVDVKTRIWLEESPSLLNPVERITGEPRFRHIFAKANKSGKLLQAWQELSDYAEVYTRESAIASGMFGDFDMEFADRVGDVVAIAKPGFILASRSVDRRVSELIGHHGGLTEVEVTVPLIEMAG